MLLYYNNSIKFILEGGSVVLRKIKSILGMLLLLLIGSFAGTLYASEEGYNVQESTYVKGDKTYECLESINDKGYLQITQIVPNSQNVKISTYVDDNKLLISGIVSKGTEVTIKVYNENAKEPTSTDTLVSTGTFSQSLEIKEGENQIVVAYKKGNVDDYVKFKVTRASEASINAIKTFIVTA